MSFIEKGIGFSGEAKLSTTDKPEIALAGVAREFEWPGGTKQRGGGIFSSPVRPGVAGDFSAA